MQESISFGTWLRQKRRLLDLTQKAFADRVGCAEVTVRRMEADEYKPSKELAFTLFEKLGIPKAERPQWVLFARGTSSLPNKPLSNLPISLTSFVGREKEQAEVIQLMSKHRLVTLTGSGGVGKTRFAMKVGEQLLEHYPDGVWWVELASLNDPMLLPKTAATLFGLVTQSDISHIDLLINFLRPKSILLILDNCEHLLDACAHLAEALLKNCPYLKILATSREPLEITGEALYRVPSLRLPDLPYRLDTLKDFESVKLFEERAQLVQFDFSLTQENIASVSQICRHLDGIPLAIELTAAKVGVLSPTQIAKQLGESLNLLSGGSRTALPRHQTLRASMNWSWDLLTEAEQRLMRQLSVFAGGWTLEAAQAVCGDDVLGLLNSLATKSLIVRNQKTENDARYSFHEIIRQYAREKLAESGESEAVRGRHLGFFLAIALKFKQELHGSQALDCLRHIKADHDNLREAMNWAGESGQALSGLGLGTALHYYWLSYGYWALGRESLERLLACPEASEHTSTRADALNLAGDLATQQGDLEAARNLLEESRTIGLELGEAGKLSLGWTCMLIGQTWMGQDPARAIREFEQSFLLLHEAGEPWRLAIAFLVRGWLAGNKGELVQARDWFSQSLEILQKMGDIWTSALPTQALGWVFYCLGDYATAFDHLEKALAMFHIIGDKNDLRDTLVSLGAIALLEGNREQAIVYFEERLAITREFMNKASIASGLCDLGVAVRHLGDIPRSVALLREGLKLSQEIGKTYLIAACLTELAGIQQQPRSAVQMLAAAQVAFEQSGEFIEPLYHIEHERTTNRFHEVLDAQDFAKFSEEGRMMALDQVVALALESTY